MLGTRMRRLRLARGMTQKELADPKYSYAYVSTIEAGRRTPSREAVEHFAMRLGVTPDELLTGRPADLEARLELSLQEAMVSLSAGAVDQAEELFRSIAKDAQRYHLPRIRSKAEEGLALWYERRSQPEEALAHHQNSQRSAQGRTRHGVGRRGRWQGTLPRGARRRSICDLPPREPARPFGAREAPRSRRARSPARLARLRVSGSRHPLQGGGIGSRAHGARPASDRPTPRRPDAYERGQALPPRGADRRRAALPPSRGRGVPEPEPEDRDGRGAPGARVRGKQGRGPPRCSNRARPRDRDLRGDVEPAGPDPGAERDGAGRAAGRVPAAGPGPPRAIDLDDGEQRPTDPRVGASRAGYHAQG